MDYEDLSGYSLIHTKTENILFEHRVLLGLTQKQVAEKAHIPFQSYQRFESGERNIKTASFQMACKVLTALEMDITKFYNGDYIFSEDVIFAKDGLRYRKTGKLISEDVTEESQESQKSQE